MIFAILIPTSLLAVLGYFVLVSAAKAVGGLQTFGKYLGLWLVALSILFLVGAATAPLFGGRAFGIGPRGGMMGGMHQMMMEHMGGQMGGGMMMQGGSMGGGMMRRPAPAPEAEPKKEEPKKE